MKLLKCCTQYVSKFGKLSSGHRTGKGQFSFQSKEGQCQRMFKLPYNCAYFTIWQDNAQNLSSQASTVHETNNFQMFKLGLEKAEKPEIKLPASVGSQKKEENSRKTSTSASLTMLKSLTVWITSNCRKFLKEMGIPDHLTCLMKICIQIEKQQLELDMK